MTDPGLAQAFAGDRYWTVSGCSWAGGALPAPGRVENLPNGQVRARGKVWPAGGAEPEAWTVERTDPIGNRQGSPGIFGSALAEIYFDNLKVYANK